MTAKQIIDTKSNESPHLRRIMSISHGHNVLVKAGNEHRRVLEEAGFTYVKNASEIRKLTSFSKVAVSPCACGNLLSKVDLCNCSDALIQVYRNRLLNLEATADITYSINGGEVVSVYDLTPQPYLEPSINYEVSKELMALLDLIIKRFNIPRARVLKIATKLATMDKQSELTKAYLLESIAYLRVR